MKNKFFAIVIAALVIVWTSCTNAPESDKAKTTEAKEVSTDKSGETWNVSTTESKIEWIGTKVSGYHTGVVPLKSGELQVKDGNVSGGKFTMDLANMVVSGPKGSDTTRNKKLLGHLKSSDFFDVQKHPEAIFDLVEIRPFTGTVRDTMDPRQEEINEYKVTNPSHTVSGNLTIKGKTKNIEFPALITVNGNSAEAIAKFNINRKDWDINYPGAPDDLIRDDIHLGISIKAIK